MEWRVGVGRVGNWWAGWERVVRTFIQPERVFVWQSKERAPKAGRIGNLQKSCSGLEKSYHHLEITQISGKMLEKKNSMVISVELCAS